MSFRLDVAIPAARHKLWGKRHHWLQILIDLKSSVPHGSKGISYLLYCSCRICGFSYWWQTLFTSWWDISQERTYQRVVKSTLWQAVSPKHRRILTLDLYYRRHCKAQDNNFPAVTNIVYNAALECILDIFWAGKQRPRVRDKLAYLRWTPPNFDCGQRWY